MILSKTIVNSMTISRKSTFSTMILITITLRILSPNITTLNLMTFSITILNTTALSITTFSMTLRLIITVSVITIGMIRLSIKAKLHF